MAPQITGARPRLVPALSAATFLQWLGASSVLPILPLYLADQGASDLIIGLAMAAVHEHAAQWRVDTNRIAVCGFSAGAHNAAMYATQWQTLPQRLRPAAALVGYGIFDYHLMFAGAKDPFAARLSRDVNIAYFGTENPT